MGCRAPPLGICAYHSLAQACSDVQRVLQVAWSQLPRGHVNRGLERLVEGGVAVVGPRPRRGQHCCGRRWALELPALCCLNSSVSSPVAALPDWMSSRTECKVVLDPGLRPLLTNLRVLLYRAPSRHIPVIVLWE